MNKKLLIHHRYETRRSISYLSKNIKEKKSDRPAKRQRLQKQAQIPVESSTYFDSLPNEVLIEIFGYLPIKDRCRAGEVCNRWYHLVRSEIFWKRFKMLDVSAAVFVKIIPSLPLCVTHLRLECHYDPLPMSLPEIMAKLHECCPSLQTFILENLHLVKNFHTPNSYHTRYFETINTRLLKCSQKMLKEHLIQYIKSEYCAEEYIDKQGAVLPELKVMSLGMACFSSYHLFSHISNFNLPKIKVLDLSYSQPLKMHKVEVFSMMTDLEELYLTKWKIEDHSILNFLKRAKKLRVLDLEKTLIGESTILALKENGKFLEELYLSFSPVGDLYRANENECFFPKLQTLCIRYTNITLEGTEKLLSMCPLLKHVDVSLNRDILEKGLHSLKKDARDKLVIDNTSVYCCDHFQKSKHFIV